MKKTFHCKLMWACVVVFIVISLFPPFSGKKTITSPEKFIGFHFVFHEAHYKSNKEVSFSNTRTEDGHEIVVKQGAYSPEIGYYSCRVDIGRLFCEIIFLSSVIAGLFFFDSGQKGG